MIIMQKTAGALAYAHRHQVAHRGLNSHAILVQLPGWPDSEPRVELADWSWAGRVHQKGTAPATQSRGDRTGRPERRAGSTVPNSSVSPRRGDDGRTGRMHQPGRSEMADPLVVAAGPVAVGFSARQEKLRSIGVERARTAYLIDLIDLVDLVTPAPGTVCAKPGAVQLLLS